MDNDKDKLLEECLIFLSELGHFKLTDLKKVEELTQQVEQCKAAIATLKEEHDFTRGQITLLNDLAEEAQGDKKGK